MRLGLFDIIQISHFALIFVIIIIMNFNGILDSIKNSIGGLFKPQSHKTTFTATPEGLAADQKRTDEAFAAKGLERTDSGAYRKPDTQQRTLGAQVAPPQVALHKNTPSNFEEIIRNSVQGSSIPASHYSNLLNTESMGFNPDVISGKINSPVGAQGIAQFMQPTVDDWQRYTKQQFDPLNSDQAIPAGADYLQWIADQFKDDLPSTYAAYNWGIGNVQNGLEKYGSFEDLLNNLPDETRNYVPRVMGADFPYNQ